MNIYYHKTIYFPIFFCAPPNIWNFIMNERRLNARLIAVAIKIMRKTHKEWCGWDLWFFFPFRSFVVIACVSNRSSIIVPPKRVCHKCHYYLNEFDYCWRTLANETKMDKKHCRRNISTDLCAWHKLISPRLRTRLSITLQMHYFNVRCGVGCVKRMLKF